jgi:hypothetical protein
MYAFGGEADIPPQAPRLPFLTPKRSSSGKAIPNALLQSGLQAIEEIGTIQI